MSSRCAHAVPSFTLHVDLDAGGAEMNATLVPMPRQQHVQKLGQPFTSHAE